MFHKYQNAILAQVRIDFLNIHFDSTTHTRMQVDSIFKGNRPTIDHPALWGLAKEVNLINRHIVICHNHQYSSSMIDPCICYAMYVQRTHQAANKLLDHIRNECTHVRLNAYLDTGAVFDARGNDVFEIVNIIKVFNVQSLIQWDCFHIHM